MGGFGFTLGRSDGFPTRYGDQYTPVTVDVIIAGIITAFLILGAGLLAITPAYNSFLRKVIFLRIFCSLFIGGVIVGGNYGHNWEKGVIKMSSPYKPGVADEIQGELGLHISLRGINVTLKGEALPHEIDEKYESSLKGERINYNEHFSWEWAQGRFGFGKYAGRFSREFREAVIRGLPLPILQVAEYFTFDGEGIRFGRHYRLAGWYSHLILWLAFGTWLITNILFCLVIRTAAFFLFITGCLQLAAVGVWTFVRNPVELQVPFQTADTKGEIILQTQYGLDYYLVFGNGIFCIVLSGLITILDALKPDEMCQCFGIDPLTIYDELLLSKDEVKEERRRMTLLKGGKSGDVEMQPFGSSSEATLNDDDKAEIFLRKKSSKTSYLVRQSIRQIKPRIPRRSKEPSVAEQRLKQPLLEQPGYVSDDGDAQKQGYGTSSSKLSPLHPDNAKNPPPAPPPKPKSRI